jgi:hypothetical protein
MEVEAGRANQRLLELVPRHRDADRSQEIQHLSENAVGPGGQLAKRKKAKR